MEDAKAIIAASDMKMLACDNLDEAAQMVTGFGCLSFICLPLPVCRVSVMAQCVFVPCPSSPLRPSHDHRFDYSLAAVLHYLCFHITGHEASFELKVDMGSRTCTATLVHALHTIGRWTLRNLRKS